MVAAFALASAAAVLPLRVLHLGGSECIGPTRQKPGAQDDKFFGMSMIPIHENAGGVTFAIKVHPRAKRNAITGEMGDALKISLTSPPIEGRANSACVEFFAKLLKVSRSSVTIASGLTSRNKVIQVVGVTGQYVRDLLVV